jgi:AcrR family transcriptional regulator
VLAARGTPERSSATRSSLLVAAEERFAAVGYHATSTTDLAALASLTRGALYHHFNDKPGLFVAVFREVAGGLNRRAQTSVAPLQGDTWRQLVESQQAYLRLVAGDPGLQRIMLIDGPAVLGWALWRDLQAEYVLGGTVTVLEMLMDEGVVDRQAPEPLARLMLAALNEAALAIAHGSDPDQVDAALLTLLEGLRVHRPGPP